MLPHRACQGNERRHVAHDAVHSGPDLRWPLELVDSSAAPGPGRSYLIAVTERRRYQRVVPDLTVGFDGGE